MLALKIDRGVPAPAPRVLLPENRLPDQLREMAVGDSALLELGVAHRLRCFGRYHGWRMVQKREDGENGTPRMRVWRLS